MSIPTQNDKAGGAPPGMPDAAWPPGRRGADLSRSSPELLLAFTLDFEAESRISLPICANTLRVLDATGIRLRDLPAPHRRLEGGQRYVRRLAGTPRLRP